jgi:L-asparagine transporter-like permease
MGNLWLKPINILSAVAILAIAVLSWVYLPREQFAWTLYLIVLILLLAAYANIRKPLIDYIAARRKAKNLPVDAQSELRLKIINYCASIAVLAIAVLSWLYIPREQFMWAVVLMVLVLLLVGFINISKIIADVS